LHRLAFGARQELARQPRVAFALGVRAVAPALLATAIWGVVAGVAMVQIGLSPLQAAAMSILVYSGSAQLAVLPLLTAGAPVSIVLLTATVINLRLLIFSAGLQPFFSRLSLWRRLLLAYITVDIGFALSLQRWRDAPASERGGTDQVWFFLGISAACWIVWQATSMAGILLGARVPADWGLEFIAIIALLAMTVTMVNNRPTLVGVLIACLVAVTAHGLPYKLGLLLAVVLGMVAALAAELFLPTAAATTAVSIDAPNATKSTNPAQR